MFIKNVKNKIFLVIKGKYMENFMHKFILGAFFVGLSFIFNSAALAMNNKIDKEAIANLERIKKISRDDINKLNKEGYSELHLACKAGNFCAVKALVEKGADIEILVGLGDEKGDAPINFACKVGCLDIVKFLLENGACTRGLESFEVKYFSEYNSIGFSELFGYIFLAGKFDGAQNKIEYINNFDENNAYFWYFEKLASEDKNYKKNILRNGLLKEIFMKKYPEKYKKYFVNDAKKIARKFLRKRFCAKWYNRVASKDEILLGFSSKIMGNKKFKDCVIKLS